MSNEIVPVRCSIVRGGTSKAIFLMNNQLPADPKAREKMILAIFGSPSLRQLDGLGGADITTSKVAIIGPPTRPDADIDYTFGQVSMDVPFVDFGGNCGNISSGVAPFAMHRASEVSRRSHATWQLSSSSIAQLYASIKLFPVTMAPWFARRYPFAAGCNCLRKREKSAWDPGGA